LKRHPVRWSLGVLGAVVLGVVAVRALVPPQVQTVSLESRELVRTLVLVGRVRPLSSAELGSTTAGTVREVLVREGDRVSRGDVLVILEDREARAALAQARAAFAEVSATVESNVDQLEREAELAQRDFERIQAVFAVGGRSAQQVEQAEQRAGDAHSRLEAAKAAAAGSENAAVAQARANLDAARARMALTRVEAPADGVVLRRSVEPGDAVQPGRALLAVAADGPSELVVFPSEDNLQELAGGDSAIASADAYPDSLFAAVVSFIAPTVDADQGTVEVRLTVPEAPPYLLPEMTVSVNIETGRVRGAQVLPASAVRGLGTNDPWVAVVRSGVLERQDVVVGLRGDSLVEIRSGLESSQAVVPPDGSPEVGARVRAGGPGEPSG